MEMSAIATSHLPAENGRSDALVLPLDRQTSELDFETATFGLG